MADKVWRRCQSGPKADARWTRGGHKADACRHVAGTAGFGGGARADLKQTQGGAWRTQGGRMQTHGGVADTWRTNDRQGQGLEAGPERT